MISTLADVPNIFFLYYTHFINFKDKDLQKSEARPLTTDTTRYSVSNDGDDKDN